MIAAWMWMAIAAAAPVDRYPRQAPVTVPACATCSGPVAVRVPVPAGLRSASDPADGTDLAIVDANGVDVPFAVLRGGPDPDRRSARLRPTTDPDVYDLDPGPWPTDGLDVRLSGGPAAATVQVFRWDGRAWAAHGQPTLVWRHPLTEKRRVSIPATTDRLRLQLSHHHRRPGGWPDVWTVRGADASVPPTRVVLPVSDVRVGENGQAHYTVALPERLPVRALELRVADPLFDREFSVWGGLEASERVGNGTVRRLRIGGASVDTLRVELEHLPRTDRLVLRSDVAGRPVLDITEVVVELEGEELLLLDPPVGELTLLGGAPEGTGTLHDLRFAAPELHRLSQTQAAVGGPGVNPEWVPPEVRSGLALPGTAIDVSDFVQAHDISGEGLVQIPLSAAVLRAARGDLGDLRLVTADGRQVPYLLRRRPVDRDWGPLETSREEQGSQSLVRVQLPEPGVPLSTLTVRSSAEAFQRTLVLNRVSGATLQPVRALSWQGTGYPTQVAMTVDEALGDTLVLAIENGDDPPLMIDDVSGSWAAWELLAWLPQEPVQLVVGAPRLSAPQYDLTLMSEALSGRAAADATLGPAIALTPPPRPASERIALVMGIVVLLGGLVTLLLRLLRAAPVDEPEPVESV